VALALLQTEVAAVGHRRDWFRQEVSHLVATLLRIGAGVLAGGPYGRHGIGSMTADSWTSGSSATLLMTSSVNGHCQYLPCLFDWYIFYWSWSHDVCEIGI
jgi:hypothetical protein